MSNNNHTIREAASEQPTKPCRICAQPIPAAAIKCTNCDSYQNWLGKVHLSTTTLSLLVALIATTVSALPVISKLLSRDDSAIYVRFWGAGGNRLVFLAANTGNRAGFVADGYIKDNNGHFVVLETDGPVFKIVEPGKSELISLVVSQSGKNEGITKLSKDGSCELGMDVMNFRSGKTTSRSDFECGALYTARLFAKADEVIHRLEGTQLREVQPEQSR